MSRQFRFPFELLRMLLIAAVPLGIGSFVSIEAGAVGIEILSEDIPASFGVPHSMKNVCVTAVGGSSENVDSEDKLGELEVALEAMLSRVGKKPGFYGPNCFNTALLAVGIVKPSDLRYVHYSEFVAFASVLFDEVSLGEAKHGDVLVFGRWPSPDHAAVMLSENQVFEKEDADTGVQEYRIRPISELTSYYGKPTRVLRRKQKPSAARPELTEREAAQIQLIQFIYDQVRSRTGAWTVGETLGSSFEYFAADIRPLMQNLAQHPNPLVQIYFYRLESLESQMTVSIRREVFGSNSMSDRAVERREQEIFVHRNDATRELIRLFGRTVGHNVTDQQVESVITGLESDRVRRAARITWLVKALPK